MIANHPGFCVCMTIILNLKEGVGKFLDNDLADAAFDETAAVYGQITGK